MALHLGGGLAALSRPSGRLPARPGLGVSSVWRAPLLTASALAASTIRAGQACGTWSREGLCGAAGGHGPAGPGAWTPFA